jgi:TetR/AcrR family transcriptional regulator, mexJK operon transcriptional repressor
LSEVNLRIGQLSEMVTKITGLRCTSAMIYNYEKLGLLSHPRRSPGGVRKFLPEDVARVIHIKKEQEAGRSLEEIKQKLESGLLPREEIPAIELPNDKRQSIINAAATVFLRKGYLDTSINEISREAGVAVSTIYQYFSNKENLFLALADYISFSQSNEKIRAALRIGESGKIQDIRQALIETCEAFLNAPQVNVEIIRMFISEVKRFSVIGDLYRERISRPAHMLVAEFILTQIRRGMFRPVDVNLAADMFMSMFYTQVINEYLFMDDDLQQLPTAEGVASIVDIFLRGILVDPSLL